MTEKDNTKRPSPINARVVFVDRFLDGEEADYIETVVDEGLRERAISKLKIRDRVTKDSVLLARDDANFLKVEVPNTDLTEEEQTEILNSIQKRWSITPGINYKLSRSLVKGIIDKDITELL